MTANEHITVGSNCYEKVKTFKYLGSLLNKKYLLQRSFESLIKLSKYVFHSSMDGIFSITWFFVSIKNI